VNRADTPIAKDLVLLGGGHSHVAVLKMFGMQPLPGVRITLISKDVWTPYSGMLPGLIAGHYHFDEAHIDLRRLCRFANARFVRGEVAGLDLKQRTVLLQGRPPLAFDLLSINTGSTPRATDIPGATTYAVSVKPVDRFLARWEEMAKELQSASARFVVVGGGAGGVELILACRQRLRSAENIDFHLVTATKSLLASHNPRTQAKFARILAEQRINVHLAHNVVEVTKNKLICENGKTVAFDTLIWVTNAAAPRWLKDSGLQVDAEGFIEVNDGLQSLSHPYVFAAGDIASVRDQPRPKSGVFAVRQGMPLANNLRAAVTDRPLRAFRPQRQFLSIISTGDKYAVASRSWWALEGAWVWKAKDRIDRRWIRQYQELPAMQSDPGKTEAPIRCGGCGAKVGSTVLSRVLSRLPSASAQNVVLGLDARDDAAAIDIPPGKTLVQSVDFFRAFIDDPYVFAKVAANHCLNDLYAKGAEPHSALAVATVPFSEEAKVEEDLYQLLSGAVEVLHANGAALLGGHSAEGAELGFGLFVNGLVDAQHLLRKATLRAGDVLILTKPLGTGTLFAAEMRRAAKGEWIERAIQTMLASGKEAARCFHRHKATACTDVTGFGLLGHLLEMLKPANLGAEISLASLPILPGVEHTFSKGIFSSLQPENLRSRRAIENLDAVTNLSLYPILFDPQTAGGLLAAVPSDQAQACLTDLKKSGYPSAAIIGKVTTSSPGTVRVSE
jgi:selenide, water dikinase